MSTSDSTFISTSDEQNNTVLSNSENKKPKGRPRLTEEEKHKRKEEYNKSYYLQHKEKAIENAKQRYNDNLESGRENSIKVSKKYRESYKLLKELDTTNKLPLEYKEKVKSILSS